MRIIGQKLDNGQIELLYDYSDEHPGRSYLECKECLKGPCRHVSMGPAGMCECPLWKDSDRAEFKEINLRVETASELSQICHMISEGVYDSIEEGQEAQV